MEILNLLVAPITEVIKCFSPSLERRIFYIIRFKRNVIGLKTQEEKLKEIKIDVQRAVEAALRNGEVIKVAVEGWLTRVDNYEREVTAFLTEIQGKKGCFQGGFSTCYSLRKGAKMKLDAVNELLVEGEKFNNSVSGPSPPPRGIETMPIPGFRAFESTQRAMDQIIKHLGDNKINCIGVYGMGGVGKTTLMKKVANEVIKSGTFTKVVMVTVSQNPNLIKIQGEIAENLGLRLIEESGIVRARRLFETLEQQKQILVILDDMWRRLELVDVGIPFGDDYKNCKVVITSRIEDVCRNMTIDSGSMVQVEVLSYEDSWHLFRENAGDAATSATLGTLPRDLAKECMGLPIAIVTLARALRNKSPAAWRDASRRLKKSMMTDIRDMQDIVFSCIKLSYDFLDSKRIKLCFLFCCLFPEDYRITVKKLMHYGIGERIFGDVQTLEEAMDRTNTIIENLVASSLLLRADDYEGEYAVVMHDVIRDVGIAIASEEEEENGFFVKAGTGLEEWPDMEKLEECKRMSLMGNKICSLPDQLPCPQILTLLLSDNGCLEQVPDRFFERMKSLRTLDLSGNHIMSLPSSFSCLINIRSLHLNFCHLKNVSLLGNLKKLEILCLQNCFIQSLPKEIGELTSLKLLDLSKNNLKNIPPNVISRLCHLEELYLEDNFIEWELEGSGDESKASLSEVTSLSMLTILHLTARNVKCFSRCNSTNANKLKSFEIFVGDMNFVFKSKDKRNMCLQLNTSDPISNWIKLLLGRTESLVLQVNGPDVNVIQLDAYLFNNLKYLKLFQCNDMTCLMSLGPNTNLIGLQSLEALTVKECDRLTSIFNLADLEQRNPKSLKLRKLILNYLCGLSTIWRVGAPSMLQLFQQLEELTILQCNEMVQIISMEEDESISTRFKESTSRNLLILQPPIFKNLKTLSIGYCGSLKHLLPVGLAQGLLQLEHISISTCFEMEEIIAVENEDTMGKVVLPRLRTLQLHDLKILSRLCQGMLLLECPSLEEICISKCPNLKKLCLFMDNVSKLKKIYAEEEWLEGLEYDGRVKQQLHQLLEKPSTDPSRMQFLTSFVGEEKKLVSLPSMVANAWSESISIQHEAILQFKELLLTSPSHSIEEVVQSGIVPRFVEFLLRDDFPHLQDGAAWVLTNITSKNTKVVIDNGAVPIFVKLLSSSNDELREKAVLSLGNIARESPRCRDLVLGHGALIPLVAPLNQHTKLSMLRNSTWALSIFCGGNPLPLFEHTKPALEALAPLIHSNDTSVLMYVCETLAYLSSGTSDKLQAVIEAGVCPRLVELLHHSSPLVLAYTLITIGNIVRGGVIQIQYIINLQALPCLLNILLSQNHKKSIKSKACWTISNITFGNKDQIQAVIEADIIGPLVHLLQTPNLDIQKQAAMAISNATFGGTHDQIKYLVSQGCIKPLCDLVVCSDQMIVSMCLYGLMNILKVGEAESNNGGVNLFAQLIDDAEGLEKIKSLLNHENTEIKKNALYIIETYWLMEDDSKSLPLGDADFAEGRSEKPI